MKHGTIAAALAAALFVAGCMGATTRTQLTNDVESHCLESDKRFQGHRLSCIAFRCPAGEMQQATAVRQEAAKFCASSPANTPENIAKAKSFVTRQNAIGSRK
jgi:hypothetical protein